MLEILHKVGQNVPSAEGRPHPVRFESPAFAQPDSARQADF